MDLDALYLILRKTTGQLRKGEEVTATNVGALSVVEFYDMPHESQAKPDIVKIDCHFIIVGVDKTEAEKNRAEFVALLRQWPDAGRLQAGPSYIEVGGVIGDQGAAFQLFALGEALGLWKVITPERLGITGTDADRLAGSGFVMMSGFEDAEQDAVANGTEAAEPAF